MNLRRVDNLAEFLEGLQANRLSTSMGDNTDANYCFYCPKEGEIRRVVVVKQTISSSDLVSQRGVALYDELYNITCLNCQHQAIALLYWIGEERHMVFVHRGLGYFASPSIPGQVSYYLDQAQRAHSMGANSAAVAMFRAALEQLLYQQGFTKGMLNQKIVDLEKSISDNTAPEWTSRFDRDYLNIVKDLGNTSIHPNDGDIEAQDGLDLNLVSQLQIVFSEMLDVIYEEPARRAARKSTLQAAVIKKSK